MIEPRFRELERLARTGLGANESPVYFLGCFYDFEPNGRASEDWEISYHIILPRIKQHYMSATGWKKAEKGLSYMDFRDEYLDKLVDRTIEFLRWYYKGIVNN